MSRQGNTAANCARTGTRERQLGVEGDSVGIRGQGLAGQVYKKAGFYREEL